MGIRRTLVPTLARVVRHRPSWWGLGLCFLSAFCVGVVGHAQSSLDTAGTSAFSRLTVRPQTMTLGTATTTAGVQTIDSLPGYLVYVPTNCVGTRRVPLVVFLHGAVAEGGVGSELVLAEHREMADKYGMILLTPLAVAGEWDVLGSPTITSWLDSVIVSRNIAVEKFSDVIALDHALTYVLKHFAIDPDKIAIGGFSDGALYASFLGRTNENVFSQVMGMSVFVNFDESLGSPNKKTRFLLSAGVFETGSETTLRRARTVRADGHDAVAILSVRDHRFSLPERDYAWNWLAQGWGWQGPNAVEPFHPVPLPDNDSLLTTDAIAKMTTFWKAVTAEPDSIRNPALKMHQVYGTMLLGQERVTTVKTDLAAIVAAYPSIAADLKNAGLTVQQEEGYRIALMRGLFLNGTKSRPEHPTIVRNLAFVMSHEQELAALWSTYIWSYEDVSHAFR